MKHIITFLTVLAWLVFLAISASAFLLKWLTSTAAFNLMALAGIWTAGPAWFLSALWLLVVNYESKGNGKVLVVGLLIAVPVVVFIL